MCHRLGDAQELEGSGEDAVQTVAAPVQPYFVLTHREIPVRVRIAMRQSHT